MTEPITKSVWRETKLPKFPKLTGRQHFDVVVIGGGITGLTAAWLLTRAGKHVGLLERHRIGAVDTGNTTAHVTMVTDLRLKDLVKRFGKEAARLTWSGGAAAINTIEQIARTLECDCEFRRVPGFLHASLDGKRNERADFQAEAELACELGFSADFVDRVPYFAKPGIRFANQAKIHPLKYIAALARAADESGAMLFEQSDAEEVASGEGEPFTVKTRGGQAQADYLVIATHVPLMGVTGLVNATLLQTKIYPYTSYVVGGTVPKGLLPEADFWDTSDPYYYLRVDAGPKSDYVIFGGLDEKTGQISDESRHLADLRAKLYMHIPEATIDHQWMGQVIQTNDDLPYIGETAERQFAATGFAGNGTTFGTLSAMMACDAVLGRENPWQQLFSPNRKKIRGGTWDYLTENLDYPYYLVADRLTLPRTDSPGSLQPGEGAVFKLDGQQVACCRNEQGLLQHVSAVCTHMGCLVHWNTAEQTWDCPCHGSRFRATGEVYAGPAESPLEPIPVRASAKRPVTKQAAARRRAQKNGKQVKQKSQPRRAPATRPSARPASKRKG